MPESGDANTSCSSPNLTSDIAKIELQRATAIVDADISTLHLLTSSNYVHIETSGAVRNKSEFLVAIDPEAGRYERYENFDNVIQVHGTVAIVTGWFENTYRRADGTRSSKRARHIRVYVLEDGCWRNIAHQATECATATL